jgi:F0F1-type ATP synthase membrane subunit c/vacuolar-type H+-ATPase subunit K
MRTLNILSGFAVLLTTLAYAHLVHHFSSYALRDASTSASFWASLVFAVAVGILSFVGGVLLLRRGR